MDEQLQQLIELQKKQNALLEKHLWRFRFSLLFLMLMTTGLCFALGFLVYKQQPQRTFPAPTAYTAPASMQIVTEVRRLPDGREVREQRVVQDTSSGFTNPEAVLPSQIK